MKEINIRTFIDKWTGYRFESDSILTKEYASFNRGFKGIMKKIADNLGGTITGFKPNHFSTSGFITVGDKHVYISISDVRYFKDEWNDHILYRTAKDTKDYTGGSNRYTTLTNLRGDLNNLIIK